MRRILIFLMVNPILLITNCLSQPTQEWIRLYPDTNTFSANGYALALDSTGNVFITGLATNNSTWRDYCTVKYSPAGVQQWVSNFRGPLSITFAKAIALDDSSNVYVTGYSNNGSTFFDFCTVKYNTNGVQQWVRFYTSSGNREDIAEKIAIDNAGNIYVAGHSATTCGSCLAYTVVKYSPDGTQLWVRTYSLTSGDTQVTEIKIDANCNIYITGDYVARAVTVKYDSSGNQLWAQEYLGLGSLTGARDIALDKSNNVYVAGHTSPPRSFFTIKYSAAGVEQWVRTFNTQSYNTFGANSIAIGNTTGKIYVSGYAYNDFGVGGTHFCTIKYSSSGDSLWSQIDTSYITYSDKTLMSIDNSMNLYVGGTYIYPRPSYIIIKYDSSGMELWRQVYTNGNGPSYLECLTIDDNYDIFITGGIGTKMGTIKYSQITGITNTNNNVPKDFKLSQNYPNPFNPSTNIKFSLPKKSLVTIIIYNLLGEEVVKLVKQEYAAGNYETNWDASEYSSGIYFCRLIADGYSEAIKMLLIK